MYLFRYSQYRYKYYEIFLFAETTQGRFFFLCGCANINKRLRPKFLSCSPCTASPFSRNQSLCWVENTAQYQRDEAAGPIVRMIEC